MIVPGVGPRDARIVLVGEAPGEEEARRCEPFVGGSGQLLTSMLSAVGISRSECYITNVVKVRPPNNDFGVFYEDKQRKVPSSFLQASQEELFKEIRAISPNIIVPLGGEALRAITGHFSIEKYRGSILTSPLGKCVPTYHPAYVLRQYGARAICELDFKRVAEESRTREVKLPTMHFVLRPSYEQVLEYISRLHKSPRVAIDIETFGPHVRSIGLSGEINHAMCIPFMANPLEPTPGSNVLFFGVQAQGETRNSFWSVDQEYEILRALDGLLQDTRVQKVTQNHPFDSLVLEREFGLVFRNFYMDTMVAHHVCYAELPKGLDFLASIYTRVPYYSDYDPSVDSSTWLYNCYDASVTLEISYVLDRELESHGLWEFYHHHQHYAITAACRAETRGIRIDQEVREEHRRYIQRVVDETVARLREITGNPSYNPNSPQQTKALLYDRLKMKPVLKRDPKTKQYRPTTDKNALDDLQRKYPQHGEVLALLKDYSEKETLLSGFLSKPLGPDGKIRTHYNVAGTVTRRWASSEPLFEIGTNLQNIPIRTTEGAKIRSTFVSDPGWSLLKADLSQAEFRLVMWMARVRRVIERYTHDPNFDCHKWVASMIYKVPEQLVTKEQRSNGKNGVYGGNYGMSERKASMVYKISYETAKFVLTSYRMAIPEISQVFWKETQDEILRTRSIVSPTGGKRIFFGRLDDDLLREAYSHRCQSIVADIICRAFYLADECFDPLECHPLLQTHDEILFHCRDDCVNKYAPRIKELMEFPLQFPGVPEQLVIPADIGVGKNWYDQKKLEL